MIELPKRRRLSARGGTTAANSGGRGEFGARRVRAFGRGLPTSSPSA